MLGSEVFIKQWTCYVQSGLTESNTIIFMNLTVSVTVLTYVAIHFSWWCAGSWQCLWHITCLWISVLHTYIFQGYFMGITTYCKTSNISHTRQYCKTSNISHTLIGNKIVEHSDIIGASPVGAAPTTSSFSTWHLASMDCTKTTARWEEKHLRFGIWCTLYQRFYSNIIIPVPEKWVCMVTLKLTGTKPQQNNNKTQQNVLYIPGPTWYIPMNYIRMVLFESS